MHLAASGSEEKHNSTISFSNVELRMHLKADDHLNQIACAYLWLPYTCATIVPSRQCTLPARTSVPNGHCSNLGSASQGGRNKPGGICRVFLIHKMGTMICLLLCKAPGYIEIQSGQTQWEPSRTLLECHMASQVARIQS